jgi:HKD family nuclease
MKITGIKVIEDSMISCLEKQGNIEIIAGLDFKTTDPKSIKYVLELKKNHKNLSFYCYGDKDENRNDVIFHPKIYLFSNPKKKHQL